MVTTESLLLASNIKWIDSFRVFRQSFQLSECMGKCSLILIFVWIWKFYWADSGNHLGPTQRLVWWEIWAHFFYLRNSKTISLEFWVKLKVRRKISTKTRSVKNEETCWERFYLKVIFLLLQKISLGGKNRFMKSATIISLIHYTSK